MSASNVKRSNSNSLNPPKEFVNIAKEVFLVPSQIGGRDMIFFLKDYMEDKKIPYIVDRWNNIIVTIGDSDIYPCFICHTDTVHTYKNGYKLFITRDNELYATDKTNKRVGCGGDDKAGITIVLWLIFKLPAGKYIFCADEESGGIGSSNIDEDIFDDVAFLGSIDRWGNSDFISRYGFGDSVSPEFLKDYKKYIKKYGYKHEEGLFTDSFNIAERVNLSAFNISCGYYQHHSGKEYVDLKQTYYTAKFLLTVMGKPEKRYIHESESKYMSLHGGWCDICGEFRAINSLVYNNGYHVCNKCVDKNISKCSYCGKQTTRPQRPIVDIHGIINSAVCPDCCSTINENKYFGIKEDGGKYTLCYLPYQGIDSAGYIYYYKAIPPTVLKYQEYNTMGYVNKNNVKIISSQTAARLINGFQWFYEKNQFLNLLEELYYITIKDEALLLSDKLNKIY